MPSKLHLKFTPAEEEAYLRKKARRAERRAKREAKRTASPTDSLYHEVNEQEKDTKNPHRRKRSHSASDDQEQYGPEPAAGPSQHNDSSSHFRSKYRREDPYTDAGEDDEFRFQEKLQEAFAEDMFNDSDFRLDGIASRLSQYSHVPRRWRGVGEDFHFSLGEWMEETREKLGGLEPWQMNDDEYAEYLRAGMYKKKHAEENAARLRKKEEREIRERDARKRREFEEKQAQKVREVESIRQKEMSRKKIQEARESYENRWASLLERKEVAATASLTFSDIPWPVYGLHDEPTPGKSIDDVVTLEAVSSFLLSSSPSPSKYAKAKEVLRVTLLRYHPDKFESRVLSQVHEQHKKTVRSFSEAVVRAVNILFQISDQESSTVG